MNSALFKWIKTSIFILLGIGLLFLAFRNMDMNEVLDVLKRARYEWILAAIVCGILSHLSRAIRWRYLVEPLGYNLPTTHSFMAVMSGYLMNFIVPRLGEASRCAMIQRSSGIPFEKLVGTVVVERVVDVLMTALITFVILFTQYELLENLISGYSLNFNFLWILIALLVIGLSFLFFILKMRSKWEKHQLLSKAYGFLDGLLDGLKSIARLRHPLYFICHSIFIWFMYYATAWLVFYSLPGTSHLGAEAALTVLLAGTLAIIIPVPGGVGTHHTIVPAALLLYGVTESDGTMYALMGHSAQMLMIFVVGGISLIIGGSIRKKSQQHEITELSE